MALSILGRIKGNGKQQRSTVVEVGTGKAESEKKKRLKSLKKKKGTLSQ